LGQRSEEGNLSVEMCSHEFFLKHALELIRGMTIGTMIVMTSGVVGKAWSGLVLTCSDAQNVQ